MLPKSPFHVLNISVISLTLLTIAVQPAISSVGDRSPFFRDCMQRCRIVNCTNPRSQQLYSSNRIEEVCHEVFRWSCKDHCDYSCMWQTTDDFAANGWPVPQFYGKV